MKLSLNWINDFIDLKAVPLEKILAKLNTSICEIDDVYEYLPQNKTIIAVKINSIAKHPDADRLRVCQVTDGKSSHQIVTNAENVSEGDIVPLALPGTVLDGKEITRAALKGIESNGMFCSEKEIGIADESHGVLVLDPKTKPGTTMQKYFDLADTILDIDNKSITHRPDLWSHFGFARELAAQLNLKINYTPFSAKAPKYSPALKKITVKPGKNAHSYFACPVTGIEITESIPKIKTRLQRCGTRSINNVVDISNYVMLEMGQPTHFFDRDKLGSVALDVAFGKTGEKIALLDDSVKELNQDILLIRNSGVPVAVAGVMGGSETAVSGSTTELVLESAAFKREDVRKSIKATGIRSDAAVRYEKGLDSFYSLPVIYRSIELLKENGCPGLAVGTPSGFNHTKTKKVVISTDAGFINTKLGITLKTTDITGILKQLGFTVTAVKDKLKVTVPWFRHNYDITIPEDIVEEVGRTTGYSKIKPEHLVAEVKPPVKNMTRELEKKLKYYFSLNMHFNEAFNYSFCSEKDLAFENNESEGIKIINDMPVEYGYMRTSIYPSLFRNLAVNADRFETVRIFETGRTYHKSNSELPVEKRWLGFAVLPYAKSTDLAANEKEFIELRSMLQDLAESLGIRNVTLETIQRSYMHPNSSISISHNGNIIAELGMAHPKWTDEYGLRKRAFIGKIYFNALLESWLQSHSKFSYVVPSIYPQDKVDISIVLEETDRTETFAGLLEKAGIREVEKVWVHDIYRGEGVGENRKSVTYRLALMNYEETFSQAKIKEITDRLFSVARENNYQIR